MGFELAIVTPEGERFTEEAESVVLPGSEGEFGVLEGHERFLSPLVIGAVQIRSGGRNLWAAVSEGFADVAGDRVTVLVETCELADDVDVARAEAARARAREALDNLDGRAENEAERQQQSAALRRAELRLEVARRA